MIFSRARFPRVPPRPQRGFSLIELVAAFLIFAVGFGVLMQILSSSIRNTRQAAEYTQAALWAQSKLDTVGFGEKFKEGSERGRFDDVYRWELQVSKYQPSDSKLATGLEQIAPVDLYECDLTVSWGQQRNSHNARFVTLRAAVPDAGQVGGQRSSGPRSSSAMSGTQQSPTGRTP
jgi:general secretion pathway protein I